MKAIFLLLVFCGGCVTTVTVPKPSCHTETHDGHLFVVYGASIAHHPDCPCGCGPVWKNKNKFQ